MPRRNYLPFKIVLVSSVLIFIIATGLAVWLVHQVSQPPARRYVVTPEKFTKLSVRGVKVAPEIWSNSDGTKAQGWLLRGTKGSPAVIMLHGYGADRSWLLNLGVKLNEATNFTILWPDLRGHGEARLTNRTSFGPQEVADLGSAFSYLKELKADDQSLLVANEMGLYGVELGSYVSMIWAAQGHPEVRALALDSVPLSADDTLYTAVSSYSGWGNFATRFFVPLGAHLYYLGEYKSELLCDVAKSLGDTRVLLLSGANSANFRESTIELANCFPNQENVELKSDLAHAAFVTGSATGEQGEAYDRVVINFFDGILRAAPVDSKNSKKLAR